MTLEMLERRIAGKVGRVMQWLIAVGMDPQVFLLPVPAGAWLLADCPRLS